MAKQIKYKPIEPLNLGVGGDKTSDFGRKYNHEIAHIYDILNGLVIGDLTSQSVDIDSVLNANSKNLVENQAVARAINTLTANQTNGFNRLDNDKAPKVHSHTASQISGLPTTLPASDVYPWAKAEDKPTYCWNEIKCKPHIITGVKYNGKYIPVIDGLADIDLVDIYDIPHAERMSELINDMGFLNGEEILALVGTVHKAITNAEIDAICV